DRMADTSPFPSVSRALHTAAAGVRAATNKAQALSAIAVCQAMTAAGLKRARTVASEQGFLDGWGRLAQVLARAASLIQTQGWTKRRMARLVAGHRLWISDTSSRDADRQRFVALDEARKHPARLLDHLDSVEALENLFPDDFQLQLGEPHADAAVN